MKVSVHIFVFEFCFVVRLVSSSQSFLYEKMHNFGLGKRVIQNYRRINPNIAAYPEPLPTQRSSYPPSPYKSIYQGKRLMSDARVYRRRFEFEPTAHTHHLSTQAMFDCVLTHVAIETNVGIPIITRGGVGYRYFSIVIKSKPLNKLTGVIRAYCANSKDEGT